MIFSFWSPQIVLVTVLSEKPVIGSQLPPHLGMMRSWRGHRAGRTKSAPGGRAAGEDGEVKRKEDRKKLEHDHILYIYISNMGPFAVMRLYNTFAWLFRVTELDPLV